MKKFSQLYVSALSGCPIKIDNTFYIRQPQIKDIIGSISTLGVGYEKYIIYLNHLSLEKKDIVSLFEKQEYETEDEKALIAYLKEQDGVFDILTWFPMFRNLLVEALGFWVIGRLNYEESSKSILISNLKGETVGAITKSNYGEVSQKIRQINNMEPITKPQLTFKSEKARLLYEESLAGEKALKASRPQDETRSFENILSVVCSLSQNYNFNNVGELTMFQLHELFERLVIDREYAVSSLRWAAWGSEPIDTSIWRMRIDE